MKALLDTNVILDVLLDRNPFVQPAIQLFALCETGGIQGVICADAATTVHYLIAKSLGQIQAREEIRKILALFDVAPVNRLVLDRATCSKITDFEDAVVHESGREFDVDAIVTRNIRDFKKGDLTVYTPMELLRVLKFQSGP